MKDCERLARKRIRIHPSSRSPVRRSPGTTVNVAGSRGMSNENQVNQDENILASTDNTPVSSQLEQPVDPNAAAAPETTSAAAPETPAQEAAVETPSPDANPAQVAASAETTPATEATAADAPAAAASAPESDEPKRKLQLKPIGLGEDAKAVPSLGDAPAADAGANETQSSRPAPSPQRTAIPLPEAEAIDEALAADIDSLMAGVDASTVPVPSSAAEAVVLENLEPGQRLKGQILSVTGDTVFVNVNLRLDASVPFRQFDPNKPPQVNDEVEIVFDKVDEAAGYILANLPRGTTVVRGGDWSSVEKDQIVECVVTKTNKGGLEATVGSLRGFIPASQVDLSYVADLEQFVGQKLRVRVTEVNPSKRKLVLSRRSLLAEEREAAKGQLLEEIKPDQTRTGRVKTIKEYGAFIDLGGLDGFLPIGQLSWVRIGHPSEVLQEGQEIEVKVLSVDREKNRISLGMRQLAPNPWRSADAKYPKGSNVTGRVTRVEAFGAFVELEPGVEGLVHISELEHRRVKRVEEVLNVGDMVEVQVLEVDPKKKRISLSAKALKAKPEPVTPPKDEDLAPGKGEPYQRKRREGLKGGTGSGSSGGLFGNPTDY
jgi:Ribosomal protein S1